MLQIERLPAFPLSEPTDNFIKAAKNKYIGQQVGIKGGPGKITCAGCSLWKRTGCSENYDSKDDTDSSDYMILVEFLQADLFLQAVPQGP